MSREILITATFREFDGGDNDQIQREFLRALEAQSYQNFRLIVTNFKEKNTLDVLKQFKIKFEYHQSNLPHYCSFTQVVENGISHIKPQSHILLWTNADMVMPTNFLQTVIDEFKDGYSGTCFPQKIYASLDDFNSNTPVWSEGSKGVNYREKNHWKSEGVEGMYNIDPNHWLPDIVFIDGDNFLDERNKELFLAHRLDGSWPGICQNLMFGFLNKEGSPRVNIVYKSQIKEILNNYANIKNPSIQDHIEAKVRQFKGTEKAYDVIDNFCQAMNYPDKWRYTHPFTKLNQVEAYTVLGTNDEKMAFQLYLKLWKSKYEKEFRQSELNLANKRLADVEPKYYDILGSKSWRLTKPLRKSLRLAKRLVSSTKARNSGGDLKAQLESHPPHFQRIPESVPNINERQYMWTVQRTLRSPLWRNKISSEVAKLIRQNHGGLKSPISKDVTEYVNSMKDQGLARLPDILSQNQIEDILSYMRHKSILDFYNDNRTFKIENIPEGSMMGRLTPADTVNCPHVMKALNHPQVLKVAEEFLGAPPTISVCLIMTSLDNGVQAKEMQLFHRDSDDYKCCKLFVYLTDVESVDHGPHVYVKNSSSFEQIEKKLKLKFGEKYDPEKTWKYFEMRRFSDQEIFEIFDSEDIEFILGNKGTSFMADNFGIHRGVPTTKGHRILLQAQYSLSPTALFNYNPQDKVMGADSYHQYVNRLYFKPNLPL